MSKKTAYLVDSGADLSEEEAKELDIYVLRMPIQIDDKTYLEGIEISNEELIQAINNGKTPKTSQPILGDTVIMWDKLLMEYDQILYIPLGKTFSHATETAIILANDERYKGKVFVVNSTFIAYPIVKYILWAREQIENGQSIEEVCKKIGEEGRIDACVIPENLEIIKRGGRISPAAASMANLLNIRPVLWLDKDGVFPLAKVHTLKKAYRKGVEAVSDNVNPNEYEWMIIDADNRAMSDELMPVLQEAIGNQKIEQHIFNATILSHAGPGTIGFGRIKKLSFNK